MFTYETIRETALDLVFPRTCVGCNTQGTVACATCWKRWQSPWVERQPIPNITQLLSFGAYKSVFIQRLIQRWKFEGDITTAKTLAQLLSPELTLWVPPGPSLFIPIPLHQRKFRERGFNQTEDLARCISEKTHLTWLPLLERAIYTRPQKSVDETDKLSNVAGAFQVNPKMLPLVDRNTHLIILDDIFTTGSTINSAAGCLKQAGFKNIFAVVVARG